VFSYGNLQLFATLKGWSPRASVTSVDQKKFALLKTKIYKAANGIAGAGAAIGECSNVLI
jgi:NADH dehydrogenase FAD-containing subunit